MARMSRWARVASGALGLVLAGAAPGLAQAPAPAAPATGGAPAVSAPAPSPTRLIDINSASPAELATLPGIGPVRAEAIVKGRPYRGKDELHRRNIIPNGVYEEIKERVVARQS